MNESLDCLKKKIEAEYRLCKSYAIEGVDINDADSLSSFIDNNSLKFTSYKLIMDTISEFIEKEKQGTVEKFVWENNLGLLNGVPALLDTIYSKLIKHKSVNKQPIGNKKTVRSPELDNNLITATIEEVWLEYTDSKENDSKTSVFN